MKNKILCLLLTVSMAMGLAAGCGNSGAQGNSGGGGNAGGTQTSDSGEIPTIKVVTMNPGTIADNTAVMEKVNEITREKIGVEVEITTLDMGQYFQQYFMLTSGGEDMDLIASYYDIAVSAAKQSAFMDLHDLLDEYGSDYKALFSEEDWKGAEMNGNLYGLPTKHAMGTRIGFEYDKDLADELGIDVSNVKTVEDWTAVLEQVHAARPDVTGIVSAMGGGTIGSFFKNVNKWDGLIDNLGVVMYDNPDEVVNLYETDTYKELCTIAYEWNQKGYVQSDAATTTDTFENLVKTGKAFSTFTTCSLGDEETLTAKTGKNIGFVQIDDSHKITSGLVVNQWNISTNAKNPEAAMKFLNLLATDAELETLINYGIEGTDYQVLEDGTLDYVNGQDASSVNYHLNIAQVLPNYFAMPTWTGSLMDAEEKAEEINNNAIASPAYGFIFDSTNVSNEVTACANVVQQYSNALECGSVDPATVLPEFISALKEAGIDSIITEKQAQYEKFLAQ